MIALSWPFHPDGHVLAVLADGPLVAIISAVNGHSTTLLLCSLSRFASCMNLTLHNRLHACLVSANKKYARWRKQGSERSRPLNGTGRKTNKT